MVRADRFDVKGFDFWKMQIENCMYQMVKILVLRFYLLIESLKESLEIKEEEQEALDRQAICVVQVTLAKKFSY